jgi:hypothetical protein
MIFVTEFVLRRQFPVRAPFKKDIRGENAMERAFLDTKPTDLPGDRSLWKGTKLLGRGMFGMVGLFENTGGTDTGIRRKVVVKQDNTPADALTKGLVDEIAILDQLEQTTSEHFVKRVVKSHDIMRIYFEHCAPGGMHELLKHRHSQ